MLLKDKKLYEDWKAKQVDKEGNPEPYGLECFNYAERWADAMEKAMMNGDKLENVAKKLSHEVDTSGITGFMYGVAVSILSKCWAYGEELRQWSNLDLQIGNEGEEANKKGSVLNPALLSVSTK